MRGNQKESREEGRKSESIVKQTDAAVLDLSKGSEFRTSWSVDDGLEVVVHASRRQSAGRMVMVQDGDDGV